MLTDYINQAMKNAVYDIIEEDHSFWGEIPGFQGVWAKSKTLEQCRQTLQEALEEWIIFRLKNQMDLPVLGKFNLNEISKAA